MLKHKTCASGDGFVRKMKWMAWANLATDFWVVYSRPFTEVTSLLWRGGDFVKIVWKATTWKTELRIDSTQLDLMLVGNKCNGFRKAPTVCLRCWIFKFFRQMIINVISSTRDQSAAACDQSVCKCGHLLQTYVREGCCAIFRHRQTRACSCVQNGHHSEGHVAQVTVLWRCLQVDTNQEVCSVFDSHQLRTALYS